MAGRIIGGVITWHPTRLRATCHFTAAAAVAFALLFPVLAAAPASAPATAPARVFEPTESYELRTIEGWSVRVSRRLLSAAPRLAERTLDLLRVRLFEVNRVLPPAALEKLRDVTVWVELADPRFPGMCFHPSAGWLRDNGYNPDKAGGIEIGNARNFLDWSDQPAMVLHELAHAYHFKVLGRDHAPLRAAYDAAVRGGKYDAVLRASGNVERAYALNGPDEFFAELSECFFLTNDFYPFVRAELQQHDPASLKLIRRLWHSPEDPESNERPAAAGS